jgi:ubiquinone/menaquinone biosynthesis C-methylase UbiE
MNSVGTTNEQNRVKWLEKTLRGIPAGSRILDAGAGEQQFRRFCLHLKYVAQDFAQYDGTGNSRGLHVGSWDQTGLDIVSDITSIPEPDASFDAIMCIEVLEHLPDPVLALKEFSRLLKDGGHLILTAPFCSLTHFAPYHFSTGFSSYFYERHLQEAQFELVEMTANGNYFEFIAQETRRIQTIAGMYCNNSPSILEKIGIRVFLNMLHKLSKNDKGSQELLCYGYHVVAIKHITS